MLLSKYRFQRPHRSFWLNVFILASVLLILPLTANAGLFDNKFKTEVQIEQVAIKLHTDTLAGGYQLIDTRGLKTLLDSKKEILIVDAMPYQDSYKKEHIPSALQCEFPIASMPEWNTAETDGKNQASFAKLLGANKDKTLVFYCGFVKCGRSHNAAAWAIKLGYDNVYRYPGGIYAWKGAGLETEGE